MIGVEASAAAVAAPAVPERSSERSSEGRGDVETATSVAPFSTQRLLHLLSELKEYQVASNHERLEVRCERVEQKTRLARLEQQLLAEEQIGHDLARRIETLEEAIRQERQMQEKSFSQGSFDVSRSSLLHAETKVSPEVVSAYLARLPKAPVSCQKRLRERLREARIPLRAEGDELMGSNDSRGRPRRDSDVENSLAGLTWQLRSKLRAHLDAVRCVCLDESNSVLFSSGEDLLVKGWDLSITRDGRNSDMPELEPFVTLRGHSAAVLSLAFRAQDRILFSAGLDGLIRAWTLPDGRICEGLQPMGHKDSVWSLQHHAYLPCMASAGADGQMCLWNTEAQETSDSRMQASFVLKSPLPKGTLGPFPEADLPSCTAWVPALTSQLLGGYTSARVSVFDVRHGTQVLDLFPEGGASSAAAVTSARAQQLSQLVATGHADHKARLLDLPSGRFVGQVKHPDCVTAVMLDPTNAHGLLTGCHDGLLRVFDLRRLGEPAVVQQMELHLRKYGEGLHSLQVAGRLMTTGGADGNINILDRIL